MLKQKQEDFVIHYYKTGNIQKSAKLAGYAEGSAHVAGNRLLKNAKVLARLEELRAQVVDKGLLTPDNRLVFLSDLAEKNKHVSINPVWPIQEINKMQKTYTEGIIDNSQTFNIIVRSEEAKQLLLKAKARITNVQGQDKAEGSQQDSKQEIPG